MCDREPSVGPADKPTEPRYGTYYGSILHFKLDKDFGGVLGILWAREDGQWRILSYDAIEP